MPWAFETTEALTFSMLRPTNCNRTRGCVSDRVSWYGAVQIRTAWIERVAVYAGHEFELYLRIPRFPFYPFNVQPPVKPWLRQLVQQERA